MKWWNDLWLKESFADYCAGTCLMAIAPKFKKEILNPDQAFLHFLHEAINEDIMTTTHPVQVTVTDTNDAANVFDKICYRKGACFIRQVAYYVGEDVLKEGIKMYFQKYSYKVTELKDFMECFEQAAKDKQVQLDLMKWMETWLQTSGINVLQPVINGNKVSIKQGKAQQGDVDVLREQLVDVAVFKLTKVAGVTEDQWDEDGDMELSHKLEVDYIKERVLVKPQEITEDVLELTTDPAAILVNYRNIGYCRMRFDESTRKSLIKNLKYMTNSGDRTYIWRTFRDMIRNNEMTLDEWYELIETNLQFETEEQTLSVILDQVLSTWKYGLFTNEQIVNILSIVSKLELTCVDEKMRSKAALINSFCSEITASGLIIDPEEILPTTCYEIINFQCKSKAQVYTFMRLLFANPGLKKEMKIKFMKCLQKLDHESIKELDNILDSQGGFTPEAADRFRKDFGPFSDQDVLFE